MWLQEATRRGPSSAGLPPAAGQRRRRLESPARRSGTDRLAGSGAPAPAPPEFVGQTTARPGADSRAAPCGASVRAAGGAAVVLERLSDRGAGGSTRGVATRLAVGPPARAHRRDEPDASPRRRSCRPSFAVAFEHRLAHRAQGKACVPLQPVQMPFEARDQRRARRGRDRAAPRPPRARRMSWRRCRPCTRWRHCEQRRPADGPGRERLRFCGGKRMRSSKVLPFGGTSPREGMAAWRSE